MSWKTAIDVSVMVWFKVLSLFSIGVSVVFSIVDLSLLMKGASASGSKMVL